MEKILLAINAEHLNMAALDFACYMGRLTKSKVTGVFLENLIADQKPVLNSAHGMNYFDWQTDDNSAGKKEKREIIEKNISLFKDACEKRAVRWSLHHDRDTPADELIRESRFADIIITDAAASFTRISESIPTRFVRDILKDAECPVIIAPENFEGIDEIIFTYNGSRSSVFAIKQFTYLFPQLMDKKTIVLQVNEKGVWEDHDKYNFREWLQNHYSSLGFLALKGDTEDNLFDYLFLRKNVFIVMGAYGRSAFSRLMRHSQADLLIKTVTQPLFISHY